MFALDQPTLRYNRQLMRWFSNALLGGLFLILGSICLGKRPGIGVCFSSIFCAGAKVAGPFNHTFPLSPFSFYGKKALLDSGPMDRKIKHPHPLLLLLPFVSYFRVAKRKPAALPPSFPSRFKWKKSFRRQNEKESRQGRMSSAMLFSIIVNPFLLFLNRQTLFVKNN